MLKISKLADYAIVIMNTIATEPNTLHSAPDIATKTTIKEPTVSKLLKMLTQANLLNSQRGTNGGYGLAQPANTITVASIIEAIDGKIAMTECDKNNSCCAVAPSCTVSSNWQKISRAIRNALSDISLADMQHDIPEKTIRVDFKRKIS